MIENTYVPLKLSNEFTDESRARLIVYYRYVKGWSMKSITFMFKMSSLLINKILHDFRKETVRRHNLIKKIKKIAKKDISCEYTASIDTYMI